MSTIKRHMDDIEGRLTAGADLCMSAGVLEQCEYCDSTIYQTGESIEGAYSLGDRELDRGTSAFEDYDDMVEAVDEAYATYAGETCFSCDEKMYGE